MGWTGEGKGKENHMKRNVCLRLWIKINELSCLNFSFKSALHQYCPSLFLFFLNSLYFHLRVKKKPYSTSPRLSEQTSSYEYSSHSPFPSNYNFESLGEVVSWNWQETTHALPAPDSLRRREGEDEKEWGGRWGGRRELIWVGDEADEGETSAGE